MNGAGGDIPYAKASPAGPLLIAPGQGLPAFPAADDATADALRALAAVHGRRLVEAATVPAGDPAPGRPGLVVALGAAAAPAALLYAHLTERTAPVVAGDAAELAALAPEVVLTTAERIDYRLMEELAGPQRAGTACGLIVGSSPAELLRAAVMRALALACAGAPARGRVFLFPMLAFERVERSEGLFIGNHAPDDAFVAGLGSGASLLVLSAHSTGYDVKFAPGRYLCPLPPGRSAGSRPPLCAELDRCTQVLGMPARADAWQAGRLVAFEAIRAQAFVALSCQIVRLADDTLGPEIHLAADLCARALVGMAVATWRPERADRDGSTLNPLLNELGRGTPAGRAVGAFNASPDARAKGVNLCLLGDPAYALAPLDEPLLPVRPPTSASAASSGNPQRGGGLAQVSLRRAMVLRARERWPLDAARTDALLAALDRRADELLAGVSDEEPCAARGTVNERLVEFVAHARPWAEELIAPFAAFTETVVRKCHACGAPARTFAVRFRAEALPGAAFVSCQRCTATALVPAGAPRPRGFANLPTGCLELGPIGLDARACLHVVTAAWHQRLAEPREQASLVVPWPRGADGRLVPALPLPAVLPHGPLRCNVYLAWGDAFAMWSAKTRARTVEADPPC